MKSTIGKTTSALFIIFALAAAARAQEIPDTIFNMQSQAFGNTIQDAPPDIAKITLIPEQPAAGKKVTVRAIIRDDPYMTAFKVSSAALEYATDTQNYTKVEMASVAGKPDLWQADIPAFPAGAEVRYAIGGWDEIGNAVFQIPIQKEVKNANLFHVITDENDTDVQPGLDILTMSYGTDGTTLYYCQTLEAPFQIYTLMNGVSIDVMGFVEQDVRAVPFRSVTENLEPFLAYVPALNIAGKMLPSEFGRGASKAGGIVVTSKGKRVCARSPISALTSTPARGLKVYSATAAYDPATGEGILADASPYAVIYFGGNSYTVK